MEKANKFIAACVILSVFLMSTMYSGAIFVIISELLLLLAAMIGLKTNPKVFNKKTLSFIVLLFMYLLFISVISQTIQYNVATTMLLFSQILFVMVIANSDKDRKTIKYIYKYFFKMMLLLAIYSIIVYTFGNKTQVYNGAIDAYTQNWNVFGVTLSQSSLGGDQLGTIDVGSILNNPNTLSYFALIALYIVAFSHMKISRKLLSGVILIVAIYISGSRLAIILACFIPLVLLYEHFNINVKLKRVLTAATFLLLIVVCILNFGQIMESVNFNGRLERWQAGMENVSLFGRGLKADEIILNEKIGHNTAMHNSYIAMLDNLGIVVTTILVIVLLFNVRQLIKNNKNKEYRVELAILGILMVASMSESIVFFVGGYNILFFIVLFSAININDRARKEKELKCSS